MAGICTMLRRGGSRWVGELCYSRLIMLVDSLVDELLWWKLNS